MKLERSITAEVLALDRRRGSLYDRIQFRAGEVLPRRITLFQQPLGSGMNARTLADTNMFAAGHLEAPYDMIVERFLFLIQPSVTEDDRNAFVASYHWQFRVMERILNNEPVLRTVAVGQPEDLIPEFGQPREGLAGEGSKLHTIGNRVCWDLEQYEVYLAPLVPFRVELYCDNKLMVATADFDMYVIMEGLRDFAVL